tara:strand:- start:41 stop:835 length:795 start_codon:yes stop_codon:yes gene_type:complete
MYNYKLLDNPRKVKANAKSLLLDIKRLLPKYLNCIPDNSALSILEIVKKTSKNNCMLETGVGVSTIALFIGSYIKKKKFFSFDTNQDKISIIKQIINETICESLKIKISDYWTPIPTDSLCKYSGIISLKELRKNFDFCFLDSNHTLNHLNEELDSFLKLVPKKFYIGVDDAHMNYKKVNLDYINLIRSKANLKKIKIKDNISKEFYIEIREKLKKKFKRTKVIKPMNIKSIKNDLYFKYYGNLSFKPGERRKHTTVFYKIIKD